jgi:hypothetical protein
MMKYSVRELVLLAVFGALWGASEIGLGSLLHATKLPFTGLLLTAIGLAIAAVGRLFIPRRGSTIFIGLIAAILKIFSIGNIIIGPMIAIISEALIAELLLSLFPRPTRPAFMLAIAGGALWTLVQPFVTGLLLYGRSLLVVWLDMVDLGSRIFHLGSGAAVWIAVCLAALYLFTGVLAGWLAWQVGRLLLVRLGKSNELVPEIQTPS